MSGFDYIGNPWESPESPRCPECDMQMREIIIPFGKHFECDNPACSECDDKYKPVNEETEE